VTKLLFACIIILSGFSVIAQKTNTKPLQPAIAIPDSSTKTTSGISSFIKQNYSSDSDRLKAIFVWEATNISYDVDNMFLLTYGQGKQEKIDKALQTRMAICEGYAELFVALLRECNISAVVVEGYTKQKGMVDYIPHAWVAAMVNNKWQLYDPTWSSGYLLNGKFVKAFTNRFYNVPAEEMIKTHMPFDPLFQFLNYPLTSKEFYDNNFAVNTAKPVFNFEDSLTYHAKLPEVDQLKNTARRIENNGVRSSMIMQMLQYVKNSELNLQAEVLNKASGKANQAVEAYNEYVQFKNKQFNPKKEDSEIAQMLVTVQSKLDTASKMLSDIRVNDPSYVQSVGQINKSIFDLQKSLDEEKLFVAKYLKTKKLFRPLMFKKIG